MNVKLLLAAIVAAVVGAGWCAGAGATAAAPAKPELDTWSAKPSLGAKAGTQIGLTLPSGAAEAGKMTLYVPAGYSLNPGAAPGTLEGHVLMFTADDFAAGDLRAVNPGAYDNTPQAQACAPGQHVAVWIMNFTDGLFSSQTVTIPIYIDPTSGDETALGAFKLQACLPLAYEPSPGGSPLGAKMRGLAWDFTRISNPSAAGNYVWRGFVSNPDTTGNPDPTTTYELRSDMPLPAKLTLSGSLVPKHHRAVLSGRLQTPSAPVSGLTVRLYRLGWDGWTRVGSTRTTVNGSYRFVHPIKKSTTFGTAVWAVGGCSGDSTAPNGCVNETRAEVDSPNARIVVRRRHA